MLNILVQHGKKLKNLKSSSSIYLYELLYPLYTVPISSSLLSKASLRRNLPLFFREIKIAKFCDHSSTYRKTGITSRGF